VWVDHEILGDATQRERYARKEASLCVFVITSPFLTAQRVIRGHYTGMGSQEQWASNATGAIIVQQLLEPLEARSF
jgi:hypothetical protein